MQEELKKNFNKQEEEKRKAAEEKQLEKDYEALNEYTKQQRDQLQTIDEQIQTNKYCANDLLNEEEYKKMEKCKALYEEQRKIIADVQQYIQDKDLKDYDLQKKDIFQSYQNSINDIQKEIDKIDLQIKKI